MSSIDHLLAPFSFSGIKLGLERMERLLAALGHPQHRVPIIHVAGSNGKGSVCAYLSSVLHTAGYRVGRYTSPHLVSWTERICLNNVSISESACIDVLERVIAVARQLEARNPEAQASQFELITAAAWVYFAEQQVDVAVIEVGLGGRLDATNVVERSLASVIVSISREHWQLLGDTLAAIATEKAGILKPGCPAIAGPLPPEAAEVVRTKATALGCPVTWVEPAQQIQTDNPQLDNPQTATPQQPSLVEADGLRYHLPLQGPIQRLNSAIAIATLRQLQTQGWSIPDAAIAQGIAATRWPGRMEWIDWRGYRLLMDGAHNADSARVLREFVDTVPIGQPGQPVAWVMGMMAGKEHDQVFKTLLRPGDRLYLSPVPDPKSAEPKELGAIAHRMCPGLQAWSAYPEVAIALDQACAQASTTPHPQLVVLCGSLYLIGHVLAQMATPA